MLHFIPKSSEPCPLHSPLNHCLTESVEMSLGWVQQFLNFQRTLRGTARVSWAASCSAGCSVQTQGLILQREAGVYLKTFPQLLYSFSLCNISRGSTENTKPTDNIVPAVRGGRGETVCPLIFCKPWKPPPSNRAGEMPCAGTNLQPDGWPTRDFANLSFLS